MRILVALMVMTAVARADSECASPSTCRPACEKGDADACAWMGDYYLSAIELQGDVYGELAISTLESACSKGSGRACARVASAYMRMFHRAQPPDSHFQELRDKACKLGETDACGTKDWLAQLEKQCTAGNAGACRRAAFAYKPPSTPSPSKSKGKGTASDDDPPPPPEEDDSGGTGTAMALDEGRMGKKDSDRAEGQYKMKKNTEDPQLARQQAIDQARAAGIIAAAPKPDAKKYASLSARADKLTADACAHGRVRTCADGGGDDQKARERACKAGASESCYELTRHALADNKPWLTYAQREWDLGDFVGCLFLANGYETGENGIKVDAAKALQYRTKGCDAHDPEACAVLAKQTTDKTKQLALYQRACDEGEPYGCEQVGDADPVRAIAMYQRACDIENWMTALYRPICHELAKKVEAKDPARAKALRKQGCDRGEEKACKK